MVFHSDRGSQYTGRAFRDVCLGNGIIPSVGQTGICFDNAAAESWNATFKKELIHLHAWKDVEHVRQASFEFAEVYYNRQRIQKGLGYLTPSEYDGVTREWVSGNKVEIGRRRKRPQQALEFERTAIRLAYVRPEPQDIAISHQQLAGYLQMAGADPAAGRAHLLAAALLYQLSGMTHELGGTSRVLARELRQEADRKELPGTLDEVIRVAEQTEGVHLDRLLTALQPDRRAVAAALAEILRAAADTDPGQDSAIQDQLQQWEPVIAATVAAAGGDSDAVAQLAPVLDQLAQDQDWAALAAVLRRIIGGDRDASLLPGLDPVGTAVTGQVLAQLAQPPDAPAHEDP